MAEQTVPAIVQEWTLRTEQAQANAKALGAQVEASAKQGTVAAAQLDGAMNRSAQSIEKTEKNTLSLRRQMRVTAISVALVGSAMRVASSDSEHLAENLGSAARETGLLVALMAPGPYKVFGIALLAVGGAMELFGKKADGAARDISEITASTRKASDSIRAMQRLGREGTEIEIEVDVNRRELEQLADSIRSVMARIDREQQKGFAGRVAARALAVDLVALEKEQTEARKRGLALEKDRSAAEALNLGKRLASNTALAVELSLLARQPAVFDDILDAEKRLVELERERRLAKTVQAKLVDPEQRLREIDDEARALGIAVARERSKQAQIESNEVAKVTRDLGKSEAVLLAERIRLLDSEADALETVNALSGDDAAITQTQADAYRKLAESLRNYGENAQAALDAQFELNQAQAEAAFRIGTAPVIDPFTNQMDEAKTRAKKDLEEVLKAASAMSQNLAGTFSDSVVDGLFDGFANADDIVIDFAKRSTKIMADALFEALLGESTRGAALGFLKFLGLGSSAATTAAAQFGGTFVSKDSIVRVAEKEPEVVLRARDLRALEQSFSTGGSQILVPHVVIDAERTVGQGVSRSLVRGIRPAIRRPRNVAEARMERVR